MGRRKKLLYKGKYELEVNPPRTQEREAEPYEQHFNRVMEETCKPSLVLSGLALCAVSCQPRTTLSAKKIVKTDRKGILCRHNFERRGDPSIVRK